MEAKFSNRVKEVISLAREEAIRLGHDYIGTEHLILGMIRDNIRLCEASPQISTAKFSGVGGGE